MMILQILIYSITCIIIIAIISMILTKHHTYEEEKTIKVLTSYNKELLGNVDVYLESKGLRYWKEYDNTISPVYHIDIYFDGTYALCRGVCFYLLPDKIIHKTITEAIDKMTASYENFKEEIEKCINEYEICKGETR